MSTKSTISDAYQTFVLEHGSRPASVKVFADALNMSEREFYQEFSSFPAIEQYLFQKMLESAIQKLESSEEFASYGAAEKLAGLFYTWLEEMLQDRSFVVFAYQQSPHALFTPFYMESAKGVFQEFVKHVIKEGIANNEVADRLFLPKVYRGWLWMQAKWLLRFWILDQSPNFEKTDEAVEKVLRLTYDLIRPNSLDSAWDVTKFLWRNK
ncbi:MAG: TetR family transcriptional regulator C-terminal domain-containing protein [Bacteroidota bacterium]